MVDGGGNQQAEADQQSPISILNPQSVDPQSPVRNPQSGN
jgi:hypothetical protein